MSKIAPLRGEFPTTAYLISQPPQAGRRETLNLMARQTGKTVRKLRWFFIVWNKILLLAYPSDMDNPSLALNDGTRGTLRSATASFVGRKSMLSESHNN